MFNESALWKREEQRGLTPQEMIVSIKQESDRVTKNYLDEPSEDNRYYAENEIETLRNMSEKYDNPEIFEYLDKKLQEIKDKHDIVLKEKIATMPPIKKIYDPRKQRRGTHA
jgi:hypothetical protein